jgi:multimeric flavodoxin WrbA
MKVIAINGSPHAKGNTFHALSVIGSQLAESGIEFEIHHVGHKLIHGCIACGNCRTSKDERCHLKDDGVKEAIQKMKEADGIILASPVYFSGIAGTMKSFLDRAFYVAGGNGGLFRNKVAASVVVLRRTGGSMTFDSLNHYLLYSEMMIATSNYWNIIHGRTPGEVLQDEEGVQTMQVLAKNMAWQLEMREATKGNIPAPKPTEKILRGFIR